MAFDLHKNLAYSTVAVAPVPAISGTSITVQTGDAAKFPAVPFNVLVWPAGTARPLISNAEILRVTAVSGDTFTTIIRATATETTSTVGPRSILVGDQIAATITGKTITDLEVEIALRAPLASPALTGVPTAPTPAVGTNSTQLATAAFVAAGLDVGICEGRLTLTSGLPVTTADVIGATSVFWTPTGRGNRIALYDGTNWGVYPFTERTLALGTLVNAQAYDVFAYISAGVVTLEMLEWANATITMTIATPGVVTWTGHGLATGNSITFTTTGALPTGVTANTQYFVTVIDANTFKLSTTLPNVGAGTFIATTGTQSGVHTGHQPQARGTALVQQDGVLSKTGALTRRYLGSFMTSSTTTTEASALKSLVWNYYNRTRRALRVADATGSWTYTTNTYQQARASTANQVVVFVGVAETIVELTAAHSATNNGAAPGAFIYTAIGLNGIAQLVPNQQVGLANAYSGSYGFVTSSVRYPQPAGYTTYVWLESSSITGITTWNGTSGAFQCDGLIGSLES